MEFLKLVIPKDKDCTFTWHRLGPGKITGPFKHDTEDEYIIVSEGKFISKVNNFEEEYDLNHQLTYIYIPKGTFHSLKNTGKKALDYFVIRIKK